MPDFVYAYYNRANILSLGNMNRQAVLDYNQAINLQDSFAEAYYNRAIAYLQIGNAPQACSDLSRAGVLGIAKAYSLIKRKCTQ
jgi:tetratricopeptide (TPR) repeat protein